MMLRHLNTFYIVGLQAFCKGNPPVTGGYSTQSHLNAQHYAFIIVLFVDKALLKLCQ